MLGTDPNNPIKMIDFMNYLMKKYKVLSKLTSKQSDNFQDEVITLLIDQNKNVDVSALQQVQKSGGIQAFILQILATVINRNPLSNQYQMTKNMEEITKEIEKKMTANNQKARYLERKSAEINQVEKQLHKKMKDYSIKLQQTLIKKLEQKQKQINKRINDSVHLFRNKEKLLIEKKKQIQMVKNQEPQIVRKQKKVIVKSEPIENKNTKNLKYVEQIHALNQRCSEYIAQIDKLKKKLKNNELAYKKLKTDNEKLRAQINTVRQQDKNIILEMTKKHHQENKNQLNVVELLEELNLSGIQSSKEKQIYEEQQYSGDNIRILNPRRQLDDPTSNELSFNLTCLKEKPVNIIQQIKAIKSHSQLIESDLLISFCGQDIHEQKIKDIIEFYDIVLQLIEMGTSIYQISTGYLCQPIFTQYFQNSYLNYQSNQQIAEATTIILSRLQMQIGKVQYIDDFINGINLRSKLINQPIDSMLDSNILYLHKVINHSD